MTGDENPLEPLHFEREDESDDRLFYREARLVTHIDDAAIEAATECYRRVLPAGGAILDLMSSWVSHLPEEVSFRSVTGLGLNRDELEQNPQLTRRTVHDLNANPCLPYEVGEFDGAVVTVSVQYLTRPVEVFAEVGRVLKPGAPFVLTYSNRMFSTKAVAVWRALDDRSRAGLIGLYFRLAGCFEDPQAWDLSPAPGRSDPLYAVMARRLENPPA